MAVELTEVDAPRARQVADEVLSREEFRELAPSLLDRVWAFVQEQIGRALAALGGGPQARLLGSLVLLAVLAVVVVLAARFARGVRRDPETAAALGGPAGRSAADWAAAAAEQEQAGRWRAALRSRYRELLAQLAAAGFVEEVPGRTTGEYSAAVRRALPGAGQPFQALTTAFERAWYSDAPVDEHALVQARQLAEDTREAAGLRVMATASR